jgi:hypothetical protein
MKRPLLFLRQLWECDRFAASLLPSHVKSGAKTPRTPKALRAKFSKLVLIAFLPILFAAQEALACPFCYGAKDGKSAEHMAIAIWFLFGAVLSVIGGFIRPCGGMEGCRWRRTRAYRGRPEQI